MKLNVNQVERLLAIRKEGLNYQLATSTCEGFDIKYMLEIADKECLEMWENLRLGEKNFRANKQLNEAIARRNKTMKTENIVKVSPEEGVIMVFATLLKPGDEVIVMEPTMPSLHEIPRAMGCKVIPWKMDPTEWGWELDTGFLKNTISSKTKLLVLNFPNNPTGCAPSTGKLQRIAQIADGVGCWIFSEESFRGMEHDPAGISPRMADIYPRAVSLGSICRIGFSSLRLGWLAAQDKALVSDFLTFKDYTSPYPNPISEILGLIFFRNIQSITLRNKKIIEHNFELAEGYFKGNSEIFEWNPPDAGPTAFPKLNSAYDSDDFCESAMTDAGLVLVPDKMFSVDMNRFRIGFGRRDFPVALVNFSNFVDGYIAKTPRSA